MELEIRLREFFHLQLLRQLAVRLASRPYAVKGGICLRFFHRSPRLSEDMDVDIDPAMPGKTLQTNVDAVLASDALIASLHIHGVRAIEVSRPKQTETTQRWKAALILAGGARLSTRVEFSRRGLAPKFERGIPDPEVLRTAYMAPFAAAYYGTSTMIQQKILALASPARNAARDLFDLHHLFFTLQATVQKMEPTVLEKAIEKVEAFDHTDFKEQVAPYLPEDLKALYENASTFKALRHQVDARLMELFNEPAGDESS